MSGAPPPYQHNGAGNNPASPPPVAQSPGPNQPGAPIAMQPMGQANMSATGQQVTPLHLLGNGPQTIDCPMCKQVARTRVETKGEGMQFLTGFLLCLVCICLAPLPCCLHWFEQTNWYCDKCGRQIASRVPDAPIHVFATPGTGQVASQYGNAPPAHMNPQAGAVGTPGPHDPQSPQPYSGPQSPAPQGYQQPMAHPQGYQQPMSPPPEGYQQPMAPPQAYTGHPGTPGTPGTPGSPPVMVQQPQYHASEIGSAPAPQAGPLPPKN